jgi:hypothetical protein
MRDLLTDLATARTRRTIRRLLTSIVVGSVWLIYASALATTTRRLQSFWG